MSFGKTAVLRAACCTRPDSCALRKTDKNDRSIAPHEGTATRQVATLSHSVVSTPRAREDAVEVRYCRGCSRAGELFLGQRGGHRSRLQRPSILLPLPRGEERLEHLEILSLKVDPPFEAAFQRCRAGIGMVDVQRGIVERRAPDPEGLGRWRGARLTKS